MTDRGVTEEAMRIIRAMQAATHAAVPEGEDRFIVITCVFEKKAPGIVSPNVFSTNKVVSDIVTLLALTAQRLSMRDATIIEGDFEWGHVR